MADTQSLDELKKLRVVDLKERLSATGLTVGGLKADLVERLHGHYTQQQGSQSSQPESVPIPQPDTIPVQMLHSPEMLSPGMYANQQQLLQQQQMMEQQLIQEQQQRERLMEQQRLLEQQQLVNQQHLHQEQQQLINQQQQQQMEQQQREQQQREQQQREQQLLEQQRLMQEQQQLENEQILQREREQKQLLEQQRLEQQKLFEMQQSEEQQRLEQKRLEEHDQMVQQRMEEDQRMMEQQEQQRLAEQRMQLLMEEKHMEEIQKAELKKMMEIQQREEQQRLEQQRLEDHERLVQHKMEEEWQMREEKRTEEMMEQQEQQRLAEQRMQLLMEEKHAEEIQKAELKKMMEIQQREEQQRLEQQRLEDHERLVQHKMEEEWRMREEKRTEEIQRAELKKMMEIQQREEQQRLEQQRLEDHERMVQHKMEEERRMREQQQRLMEEQKQREQQERLLMEQRQKEEEDKIRLAQQQTALLEQEKERRSQQILQDQALLQSQLLAVEQQTKEHQEDHMREQQRDAMARQQQAMIAEEQHQQQSDMIHKVVHQQQMLEAERQQQAMMQQQQQQAVMEAEKAKQAALLQQHAVIEQQQKEVELLHQQQIAIHREQQQHLLQQQQRQIEESEQALIKLQGSFPPGTGAPAGRRTPPSLMSLDVVAPATLKPGDEQPDVKLPQALEKVLAFKDVRAQEISQDPDNVEFEGDEPVDSGVDVRALTDEAPEDSTMKEDKEKDKDSKNKRRRKKKKRRAKAKLEEDLRRSAQQFDEADVEPDVEIEYVQEELNLDQTDPQYSQFAKIFEAFKISAPDKSTQAISSGSDKTGAPTEKITKGQHLQDLDVEENLLKKDDKPRVSKKKLKKLNRLSVAELKQLVNRPDVVEMHDVTAQDPKLCVLLKSTRNSVSVPRHWCFKRKYLQGKRGIEKAPFDLPDYIKATGIMEMREALAEKEDQKTLKSKMREKVRPKMGKIDIDYQKLHDAFFRWQTKPRLTIHGDLYYEGKEFETRLKEKKPGNLSDDLRTALGMPIGAGADKFPPPWLIAMQRYGPPPSYPNLKIPGLNAAIPDNCTFGYHAGGWGKPPVDEHGKPLYGDVFGTQSGEFQTPAKEEEIDRSLWGELESESESESESEEESDQEKEEVDKSGLVTPGDPGLVTPSGITSIPAGMETPDMIELRKKKIEDLMEGGETPALYTVVPEKKASVGGAMMGSAHVYDMSGVAPSGKKSDRSGAEGVDIALNPDELDLDTAAMQAKYEQRLREQQSQLEKEDLSDMVAEHAAKQKKRKKQQDGGKSSKKYKEFKF